MANINTGIDLFTVKKKIANGAPLNNSEMKTMVQGSFKQELENALPMHLKANVDRYARQVLSLYSANPKLQECAPLTVLTALMTAAELGLDFSPVLGQCYIVPYDNNRRGVKDAQLQLGYRGMISLARRSGEITNIYAEVVHEKDTFSYELGLNRKLVHIPCEDPDKAGKATYYYAVVTYKDMGYDFKVWPMHKMFEHALKYGQGYVAKEWDSKRQERVPKRNPDGTYAINKKSVWHQNFDAMAMKTMIRMLFKTMPLSPEIIQILKADGAIRSDLSSLTPDMKITDIDPDVIRVAEDEIHNDEPDYIEPDFIENVYPEPFDPDMGFPEGVVDDATKKRKVS